MLLLTTNIMMIICNIIRAQRVSGDVAGGGGAPTNDNDDGDSNDDYDCW